MAANTRSGSAFRTFQLTVPARHPTPAKARKTAPVLHFVFCSRRAKAREGGPAYIYSLLTGYQEQPAKLVAEFPGAKTPESLHYNPYFANLNVAMPPPLTADGQVTYADGTPATVDQMAKDV